MNQKVIMAVCSFWLMVANAFAITECVQYFPQCSLASDRVAANGGGLNSVNDAWDVGWSDGFVMGVALATVKKFWCPERGFNGFQVSAVVSKYVKNNPERWGEPPEVLVAKALSQAFPCKK